MIVRLLCNYSIANRSFTIPIDCNVVKSLKLLLLWFYCEFSEKDEVISAIVSGSFYIR